MSSSPIYSNAAIEAKVAKLKLIYPTIGWPELLELTPQLMEIVEVVGYVKHASDEDKHAAVAAILNKLMSQVIVTKPELQEVMPLLIKTIDNASKGKYGINKEQDIKL